MHYEDWNAGLSSPKHCFPAGDTEDLRAQRPAPAQAPTDDSGRAAQGPWTPKTNQGSLHLIQHLGFFAKISSIGAITRLWTVSQFCFMIFQVGVINTLSASLVAQMVRIHLQCRRPRFTPWVGKIPWKRKWQPTPVFLPGEVHRQRSLVGYSLWGLKESDTTEQLILQFQYIVSFWRKI